MTVQKRTAWRSKRPAPYTFAGSQPAAALTDNVEWTREVQPREHYRIQYKDRDDEISVREIELRKVGTMSGAIYFGVMHLGKFKTFKADRILHAEQLTEGHPSSIRSFPTYSTELPPFPVPGSVFRVPTVAGKRTWLVDLNQYTCTCPEKRERAARGYTLPQLGAICPHVARAILVHLPANLHNTGPWSPELLSVLADPRKMHLDNLC